MRRRPSPNHGPRPGKPVDVLLLHYTGMASAAAALDRLCDPAVPASAHYLIEQDGTVWQLVEEDRRAWHAGVACWDGESDVNGRSIGIELCNPGHGFGYRAFPPAQLGALADLARGILARWPIPPDRVLAHADVAPERKLDPGELLDWRWLAGQGVGLLLRDGLSPAAGPPLGPGDGGPAVARLAADLARWGYRMPAEHAYGPALARVVAALQRHWRPACVDGIADAGTRAVLAWLLDRKSPAA